MTKGKAWIILPLILAGAIIASGVGMIGLLLQLTERDGAGPDIEPEHAITSSELLLAKEISSETYRRSLDTALSAEGYSPEEKGIPIRPEKEKVPLPPTVEGEPERTRGEDDLTSMEGYMNRDEGPGAPEVNVDSTSSLLGEKGSLIEGSYSTLKEGSIPDGFSVIDIDEDHDLPITEEGISMEEDMPPEISKDMEDLSDELSDVLGENAPDAASAGIDITDVAETTWTMSNSTSRDSDLDGNPEYKYEIKVAYGRKNNTVLNSSLEYIAGYEYEYRDADSDGIPNYERLFIVKYANYTVNGNKVAEGVSFTEIVKNDTDGDSLIDREDIKHLSYGYHATLFGTVKSFARAGEISRIDDDADSEFDRTIGSAVFYMKNENVRTNVTLRESFIVIKGSRSDVSAEYSSLAFTRLNGTSGNVLLEDARIMTYKESGSNRNLVLIAGRNNTVTGRVQYGILNLTASSQGNTTTIRVTGFALENATLLLGGTRSDAVAVDYTVVIEGTSRTESGFLAASRTDMRPKTTEESVIFLSMDRSSSSNVTISENVTVFARVNVTGTGLTSTSALAMRNYADADADGNAEYLKEAWVVGRSEDLDNDGIVDREGYAVHWTEVVDEDSDGNPERINNFTMMGWKHDTDDDGNVDIERGLMVNVTWYDENSNATFELKETGILGFEKKDTDSDGVFDSEKYAGAWEKIIDVHDDGTEINKQSGTWTHEV